jgi:hypothetical protein
MRRGKRVTGCKNQESVAFEFMLLVDMTILLTGVYARFRL